MNFENVLKKLEEITKQLQEGNLTLAESLRIYKEGIDLLKTCSNEIEEKKSELYVVKKQADKLFVETLNFVETQSEIID